MGNIFIASERVGRINSSGEFYSSDENYLGYIASSGRVYDSKDYCIGYVSTLHTAKGYIEIYINGEVAFTIFDNGNVYDSTDSNIGYVNSTFLNSYFDSSVTNSSRACVDPSNESDKSSSNECPSSLKTNSDNSDNIRVNSKLIKTIIIIILDIVASILFAISEGYIGGFFVGLIGFPVVYFLLKIFWKLFR